MSDCSFASMPVIHKAFYKIAKIKNVKDCYICETGDITSKLQISLSKSKVI